MYVALRFHQASFKESSLLAGEEPGASPRPRLDHSHCHLSIDSVDTSQDNPFDGAPEPAPGAPLLTETDSKFLTSFFEDITSNQYNMPSFGEGLNFSDAWLDLPPQFMGSATSFGPQDTTNGEFAFSHDQQSDMTRMLPTGSSMMPPPPPPPAPSQPQSQMPSQAYSQQHSDDVLTAAATLVQNGSRGVTTKSNVANGSPRTTSHNDQNNARRPGVYPVGHLRHQQMEEFTEENRRSGQVAEVDHTFTRWMWGEKEKTPVSKPVPVDIQWGSDANFTGTQGYVPESRKEMADSVDQSRMKYLDCLEVNQDAASTQLASPNSSSQVTTGTVNGDGPLHAKREEDANAPPRKRRKSKNVQTFAAEDEEDDDDDAANSHSGRKRKTKSERSGSGSEPSPDANGSGRRRKSVANGTKPPRENLTEEQKRENHIRSEQKRRTLIKEGFDDLGELVPGLRGGSFSKSTTLSMAAEWLEELLRGNKALTMQMLALEQR